MKRTAKVLIIFVIVCFACAFVGCSQVKTTLAVPQNVQVIDNVVRWNAVDGAIGYYVLINGIEYSASDTSYALKGASIKSGTQCQISVKTKGDGYVNLSSEYSEPISYLYIASEVSDDNNSENNNTGNNNVGNNNNNTNTGDNNNNNGGNITTEKEELSDSVINSVVNSNSTYYGVGRTINVITDEYARFTAESIGHSKVFDSNKLMSLNWYKQHVGDMVAETAKGSSMEELYVKANLGFKTSFSSQVGLGNVFSAGMKNTFGFSAGVEYQNTANEIYHMSSQYFGAELVAIDEYYDIEQFKSLLSAGFISDIIALENGTTTAKNIINKYGTHAILAGYYGGKISCYSYIRNTSTKWSAQAKFDYESNIDAAIGKIMSGSSSTEFSLAAQVGITSGTSSEEFKATAIGGANVNALSLQDFLSKYGNWVDSMNNMSAENSVIVGLPQKSLVSIWDILPNEYSTAKSKLKTYFDAEVENTNSEFLSDYERHYIEPTPDIDYGNTTEFAGGHGTIDSPYLISTSEHLRNVDKYLDKYFALKNDISINTEWIPIGQKNSSYEPFTGTFDGMGYKITSIKRTTTPEYYNDKAYFGLFGIAKGATIKNVSIDANLTFGDVSKVPKYMSVGAMVGCAEDSNILNCGVTGSMSVGGGVDCEQYIYVGGLVGQCSKNVNIKYCTNKAAIRVRHRIAYVGGLVGNISENGSSVKYSYNIGNIDVSTGWWVGGFSATAGGIVGYVNDGKVANVSYCYTKCDIKVTNGYYRDIGGIIGTATHGDHNSTVSNNVFCTRIEYNEDNKYDDSERLEIKNIYKKGSEVSESTLTSGGQVGNLFRYSESDFRANESYCWIYQSGSLPKLYWEK